MRNKMSILEETIERFRRGRDYELSDAEAVLDALIIEPDENLLVEVFRAWNQKGIGEHEIYSIARIMRERCTRIRSTRETYVDIVGTGGSRSKTFNVSTAAAFVVAGAGVPVAKHGNRAATSNSGSADVLSELGIEPTADAATAERCLNDIGVCFMFAPNFHRLSPTLGKVRRGLGFPTIFNCVGPLCNPAFAPHQLIGVWDKTLVPKMASALSRLGTKKSWIVHAADGLDEISLSGPTLVAEVDGEKVKEFEISPSDFGVEPQAAADLAVDTPSASAALIKNVLDPNRDPSAARDLVSINAAAAIRIAGGGEDLKDAFKLASDSIARGYALGKLESFIEVSKK